MKLAKASHRITALLCITTVCLLSLASTSPQVHDWLFHCEHFDDMGCMDAHTACTDQSEKDSEPEMPESETDFCPVMLFEQGVTITDSPAIQLSQSFPLAAIIAIEPDTVPACRSEGSIQARAPPIS